MGTVLAIGCACGVTGIAGVLLLAWLDSRAAVRGLSAFLFAATLGMTANGFLVLGIALLLANLGYALAAVIAVEMLAVFLLWPFLRRRIGEWLGTVRQGMRVNGDAILFCALATVCVLVMLQAMLWDASGKPFADFVGWGDGAYHLGMVQRLVTAQPFTLQNHVLAGKPLTYPFLMNFLTAALMKLGVPMPVAWHLPGMLYLLTGIAAFRLWGRALFRRRSLAFWLVVVVFLGAGLGFWWFFGQVQKTAPQMGVIGSLMDNLNHPRFEYTHLDTRTSGKPAGMETPANIVWMVPIVSFFSHQRSFVAGLGLGSLFLYGFWTTFQGAERRGFGRWMILLGFLSVAHMHTLVALSLVAVAIVGSSLLKRFDPKVIKEFLWGVAASVVLAAPMLIAIVRPLLKTGTTGQHFFSLWLGWFMCEHNRHWFWCDPGVAGTDSSLVWFWLKNWGAVFVLWVIGTVVARRRRSGTELVAPGILLFTLPNLILFQPWAFDNNKILFWWWVFAAALGLKVWDSDPVTGTRRAAFWHGTLVLFIVCVLFSGMLDVIPKLRNGLRIKDGDTSFSYSSPNDQAIAAWVTGHTAPNDGFLTSSEPAQFVPLLTGRPVFLGYAGWLWSQGYASESQRRQGVLEAFLATGDPKPLCASDVRWWVLDDAFRREHPQARLFKPDGQNVSVAFTDTGPAGAREILMLHCPAT